MTRHATSLLPPDLLRSPNAHPPKAGAGQPGAGEPLTGTGITDAWTQWMEAAAPDADWAVRWARFLSAAAAQPASVPDNIFAVLDAWTCAQLGHEWVSLDDPRELPYCLWCQTEQVQVEPTDSSGSVTILVASVPQAQGSVAYGIQTSAAPSPIFGQLPAPATTLAALLTGVIEALRALPPTTPVFLVVPSESVTKPLLQGTLARWQANGWQTAKHRPVAHHDLWATLAPLLASRSWTIVRKTPHDSAHMAHLVQSLGGDDA